MTTIAEKQKFAIHVLIMASILMFLSLFTAVGKIIGVFMALWLAAVFWNTGLMLKSGNVTLRDFAESISREEDKAQAEGKRFKKWFYRVIIPFMILGLIMVAIILYVFFFILP